MLPEAEGTPYIDGNQSSTDSSRCGIRGTGSYPHSERGANIPRTANLTDPETTAASPSGAHPGDVRCCELAEGPFEPAEARQLAGLFHTLSDPTRLRLVSFIAAEGCRPVRACDAVGVLGVAQPTVSHHLKVLAEAGLLRRERSGRNVLYAVNPQAFQALRQALELG
ncbi:transcriptional regulator [Corynebacterium heidelbergense]|uniref:Transcriptional regulator n=1 Tax=Corynebacterium heidelbergense TaxID=2055947 RepID=A0A364V427_9CORY|nr:transcriptional regulator [Corynebacterium heidelbergense]